MGLDTSHGAFHGPYSRFNRFRQVVAKAIGGSYPPHWKSMLPKDLDHIEDDTRLDPMSWYWSTSDPDVDGEELAERQRRKQAETPGLYLFFNHSDCDGEFTYYEAKQVADDLSKILTNLGQYNTEHDNYVEMAQQFIDGCLRAYEARESLEFH